MFIVKTPEISSVINHYCHSFSVANDVLNYIQNKYSIELEIKEVDGLLYFDPGGCLLIDPFFTNIKLKNIECRIDNLDILLEIIEGKKFTKSFCRIFSICGNLCFSKEELEEIKNYAKDNQESLEKVMLSVDNFWENRFGKLQSSQ